MKCFSHYLYNPAVRPPPRGTISPPATRLISREDRATSLGGPLDPRIGNPTAMHRHTRENIIKKGYALRITRNNATFNSEGMTGMNPVSSMKCGQCMRTFERPSSLKDHVKHDHQSSIKLMFPSGSTMTIVRDVNGGFKCPCGRSYSSPRSIRRHVKDCRGSDVNMSQSTVNEVTPSSMEDKEKSVENDLEMEDVRSGCIGIPQFTKSLH